MASCSRDSTVRLWSLTPLITPLLLNIITDQPWEKITGNTGEEGSEGVRVAPPLPRNPRLKPPVVFSYRHGHGSWLGAVALWKSVSGHQAGAGQAEL